MADSVNNLDSDWQIFNITEAQSLNSFHVPKTIVQVMYRLQTNTFVQLQSSK